MKTCSNCKEAKPESNYSKGKYQCKSCQAIYALAYHKKHPEQKKAHDRAYARKNTKKRLEKQALWRLENAEKIKAQRSEYQKQYRIKNQDKCKARAIVGTEIKAKRLLKQPCMKCGCEKVEAHHEDYSKPLEIIWLCVQCHKAIHRIYKNEY